MATQPLKTEEGKNVFKAIEDFSAITGPIKVNFGIKDMAFVEVELFVPRAFEAFMGLAKASEQGEIDAYYQPQDDDDY